MPQATETKKEKRVVGPAKEMAPLVYRGSREICEAVGLDHKQMARHVKELGLPAFKIAGQKSWLACPGDLAQWIECQRNKYLEVK